MTGALRAPAAGVAPAAHTTMGWLADGTPFYAPLGGMLAEGDRVCCHLCGRWFLSVASHLRVHGWVKADYTAAFGLERGNPLSGEATRKRRSAALTARQAVEPAIAQAQARARIRARSGALTRAATGAARGRAHPTERRAKTLAALAVISPQARAEGTRRRGRLHLQRVAAQAAARLGFADFASYLLDRLGRGLSMAAISREAGLHKDWVSRQAPTVAPQIAQARHQIQPHHTDVRLQPVAQRFGFGHPAAYLRARHVEQHRSVAALAAEAGVSRATIRAALTHHGIAVRAHATTRHQATQRDQAVAGALGFDSLADYIAARRTHGATWTSMVAESGVAETTLRRHAWR